MKEIYSDILCAIIICAIAWFVLVEPISQAITGTENFNQAIHDQTLRNLSSIKNGTKTSTELSLEYQK